LPDKLKLKTTGKFKTKSYNVVYLKIIRFIDNLGKYFITSNELQEACQYENCAAIENLELYHFNPMVSPKRKDSSLASKILFVKKRKIVILYCKYYRMVYHRKLLKP
jgi:hypothetical protein